jgi:hypothetical protein
MVAVDLVNLFLMGECVKSDRKGAGLFTELFVNFLLDFRNRMILYNYHISFEARTNGTSYSHSVSTAEAPSPTDQTAKRDRS